LQLAYLFGVNAEFGSVSIAVPKRLYAAQSQQLVCVFAIVDQVAVLRQPDSNRIIDPSACSESKEFEPLVAWIDSETESRE
jgi:hypothetical protein